MDARASQLLGIRAQYRALFPRMAQGGRWHIYRSTAGFVLLMEGAHMDVDLPVALEDVQALSESMMIYRLHDRILMGEVA